MLNFAVTEFCEVQTQDGAYSHALLYLFIHTAGDDLVTVVALYDIAGLRRPAFDQGNRT